MRGEYIPGTTSNRVFAACPEKRFRCYRPALRRDLLRIAIALFIIIIFLFIFIVFAIVFPAVILVFLFVFDLIPKDCRHGVEKWRGIFFDFPHVLMVLPGESSICGVVVG